MKFLQKVSRKLTKLLLSKNLLHPRIKLEMLMKYPSFELSFENRTNGFGNSSSKLTSQTKI